VAAGRFFAVTYRGRAYRSAATGAPPLRVVRGDAVGVAHRTAVMRRRGHRDIVSDQGSGPGLVLVRLVPPAVMIRNSRPGRSPRRTCTLRFAQVRRILPSDQVFIGSRSRRSKRRRGWPRWRRRSARDACSRRPGYLQVRGYRPIPYTLARSSRRRRSGSGPWTGDCPGRRRAGARAGLVSRSPSVSKGDPAAPDRALDLCGRCRRR